MGGTRGRACVKHISTLAQRLARREAGGHWGDELQRFVFTRGRWRERDGEMGRTKRKRERETNCASFYACVRHCV